MKVKQIKKFLKRYSALIPGVSLFIITVSSIDPIIDIMRPTAMN